MQDMLTSNMSRQNRGTMINTWLTLHVSAAHHMTIAAWVLLTVSCIDAGERGQIGNGRGRELP